MCFLRWGKMLYRSIEDEMQYYKNKILKIIADNPGRYGTKEIEGLFGLDRNKIEGFILEYKRNGFEIGIKKGKYFIDKSEEHICELLETAEKRKSKMQGIFNDLKSKGASTKKINREGFLKNYKYKYSISLSKALNLLEGDGLISVRNGYIHVIEPPFERLNNEQILRLLIIVNVLRNIYPKRNLISSIFRKLSDLYEVKGFKFNQEAVQCTNKCKIGLCEELALGIIEEALYQDKSLEFSYKTQVGIRRLRINPSGIIYNNQKDAWYVVSVGEFNTEYKIAKMMNVKIVEGSSIPFPKNLYEYSMGVSGEGVTDVKAAFKKEEYIYRKLLNYVKLRKSAEVRETNNAYILTDRVCGTNEFKKWLRGFGKDAACIKPDRLREEISKEVKLLKERYEVI